MFNYNIYDERQLVVNVQINKFINVQSDSVSSSSTDMSVPHNSNIGIEEVRKRVIDDATAQSIAAACTGLRPSNIEQTAKNRLFDFQPLALKFSNLFKLNRADDVTTLIDSIAEDVITASKNLQKTIVTDFLKALGNELVAVQKFVDMFKHFIIEKCNNQSIQTITGVAQKTFDEEIYEDQNMYFQFAAMRITLMQLQYDVKCTYATSIAEKIINSTHHENQTVMQDFSISQPVVEKFFKELFLEEFKKQELKKSSECCVIM